MPRKGAKSASGPQADGGAAVIGFQRSEKNEKRTERHQPTQQTRNLVALGCFSNLTHDQIAKLVGINRETLTKYYREELDTGAATMVAKVANNLYALALQTTDRKVAMTSSIFILKTRGGWQEGKSVPEHPLTDDPGEDKKQEPVVIRLRIGDRPPEAA